MMAETELEEGEACSSHGYVGGDGADFDPFVALSYIDDKINHCLGHLQKDFEGGITADKLGAKFGGYGSFLPSYQRSPSNWALPEQSHNNTNVGSNVNNQRQVPRKGPLLPLDVIRKASLRSGSEGAHSAPSTRYPSAHVPTKDTCLDSSRVLGKGHEVMLEPQNKSVGVRGSRKLELRMKEDLARKNAELYTGLGLDYSSSASSDTSTEGTGSLPHESEVTSHESPTSIIQIMTAFPFPERMLSPLHDKLIHLAGEGNFHRGSDNQLPVIDMSVGKSADITPGAKVSKMKVSEHANKKQSLMNSRRESGIHSDNDLEVLSKRLEETSSKPVLTMKACKTREATDIETKTCRKAPKDAIEQQLFYSGTAKYEDSESDQNHNSDDSLYARHGLKCAPIEKHPTCKRMEERGSKSAPTVKACKVRDATDKATTTFRKASKTAIENQLFSSDSCKDEESESEQNHSSKDNSYARHDTNRALVEKHPACKRTEETGSKPKPTVKACKPRDATDKATKTCRKAPKDAIEEQLFSSDSAKDEDSEADQTHTSNDYLCARVSSKLDLVGKHPACSNMDNSADHQHDSVHRSGRILDQRMSQCKDDFAPGLAGNEATLNKMIDTRKPSGAEKQSSGSRKKASGIHSHEMPGSLSEKESAGVLRRKKNDCDFSGKSGTNKSKKDINMGRVNYRSSADSNLKPLNSQRDAVVEQRFGAKLKASNQEDNEKDQSRGKSNIQEVDHQAASERLLPEASHSGAVIENGQDLPKDNWVCCDSCQKWRLLPLGRMTEDLPEHWVCSMMDWLPRMNCDVPEDEATAAVQLQNAVCLNSMHDNASRSVQGFNSASFLHLDHNLHDKNATSVLDHRKKKHGPREILHAANASTPRQILKPKKKYRKDSATNGSMIEMVRSSLPSDIIMPSTTGKLNETSNSDIHMDKRNLITEGDSKQIKAKRKMEVDSYRMPKKFKNEFEYHTNEHRKSELDMDSEEMEKSMAKASLPQSVPDTRSLETKPCIRRKVLIKRKKSDEWQDSQNLLSSYQGAGQHVHNNHLSVKEPREAEVPKAKKAKMPKSAPESGAVGSNKSHKKEKVNQNVVSSSDAHLTTVKEKARGIEAEKLRVPKCEVAARDSLCGLHSLESDPCPGPVSAEAAPKASSDSGSHKNKVNIDELRGSQLEFPSSSPSRTTKAHNLGLLSGENLKKENDADCRMPVTGSSRQCLEAEGTSGNTQHETVRKEKTSHSRSLDSHVLDFRDKNAPHKSTGKFKVCFKSSKLRSGQLNRDGSAPEKKEQRDELHRSESYDGTSMSKNDPMHSADLDTQKSVHVCSFQSKKKDVKFGSHSEKEEIKPSDSLAENGELHSRKKSWYAGNTRSKHDTPDGNGVKSVGKDRIHMGGTDTTEKRVSVERAEGQLKGAQQQHTKKSIMEDSHDQNHGKKTSTMLVELQVGKSQRLPIHEGRQNSVANPAPGSSKEAELDASKVLNLAGDKRPGSSTSNQPLVSNNNDTAPITKESFAQSKTPLMEAEDLRAYADRLKNSGFLYESAEVYFQAALKFLDSASFLEAGNSGSNSHGKMTPMQMYSSTAKLCESCVHEYERLGETAAAALVYKCMEVAYMKMVYCKHFSANRLRNELQATIQMVPQGESPSSSASDLDNLNNQGSIEKATLCKGSAPHIFGSPIPAAQNRNFSRLLDFTQDVTSAMEASMKSQAAFAVASPLLEEANKKEAIAAVKRALDFSFQDVGELVKLVNLAKESISR